MNLPPVMDTGKSFQYFIHNVPNDSFWNFFVLIKKILDEPCQGPVIHVLHEHKQALLEKICEVVINDVRGVAHLHCCHFLLDLFQGTGFVQFNNFDCVYDFIVEFRAGFVDFTHGAFSNLLNEVVSFGWIFFSDSHFRQVQLELIRCQKLALLFGFIQWLVLDRKNIDQLFWLADLVLRQF